MLSFTLYSFDSTNSDIPLHDSMNAKLILISKLLTTFIFYNYVDQLHVNSFAALLSSRFAPPFSMLHWPWPCPELGLRLGGAQCIN